MKTKQCNGRHSCGEILPIEEFSTRTRHHTLKDGTERTYTTRLNLCKCCEREYKNRNQNVNRMENGSQRTLSYAYDSVYHITRDWQVVRLSA